MNFLKLFACCLSISLWSGQLHAKPQAERGIETIKSLKNYVQEFYDWYVPKALETGSRPSWKLAVEKRSSTFEPHLVEAIQGDLEAQSKSHGVVVGLDFDPFLNSQDPSELYMVGKVFKKGKSYWIDVHEVHAGTIEKKPGIVVEAIQQNDHWVFVDFHYEGNKSLLKLLKRLRDNRQKASK